MLKHLPMTMPRARQVLSHTCENGSHEKNVHNQFPDKVKELVTELAQAFRNGRTTPGPKQKNEGWPNTISKRVLQKFPQLADPKIKSQQ